MTTRPSARIPFADVADTLRYAFRDAGILDLSSVKFDTPLPGLICDYLAGERPHVIERLARRFHSRAGISLIEGGLLLCAVGIESNNPWHETLKADNPAGYEKAVQIARVFHKFFAGQQFGASHESRRLGQIGGIQPGVTCTGRRVQFCRG